MFKKLSTSYHLVQVAFKYIARDAELLSYTLLSIISALIILVGFYYIDHFYFGFIDTIISAFLAISSGQDPALIQDIGSSIRETFSSTTGMILLVCIIFTLYLISAFINLFFNGAIITSVQRRINGKDNKFLDGLKDSLKNIRKIMIWSSISATIGTLLEFIQQAFGRNSIVNALIVRLIGGLWDILTFFSFPLMILKDMGAGSAIKESSSLFKKTWGERAIVYVGVGFVFGVLYFLLFLLSIIICVNGFLWAGVILFVGGVLLFVILSSTCNTIINTLLLHYAYTGTLPEDVIDQINISDIIREQK